MQYGGNPVSCSMGLAVLDVIRKDHLMENALKVGTYFIDKLNDMKNGHRLIGDVRYG